MKCLRRNRVGVCLAYRMDTMDKTCLATLFYAHVDFLHESTRFCDLLEAMRIPKMQFVPLVVCVEAAFHDREARYELKAVFRGSDEIIPVEILRPNKDGNMMFRVTMVADDATFLLDWGVKSSQDPKWKERWKMTAPVRRYMQRKSTLAAFEELPFRQYDCMQRDRESTLAAFEELPFRHRRDVRDSVTDATSAKRNRKRAQ